MKKYNKTIMMIIGTILVVVVAAEIILLIIVSTQSSRYTKYWAKRAVAAPQSNELLYVAVGDSVGVGVGAGSPGEGYVGLLARSLEQKAGRTVRVINLSMSGAKISDGVATQIPVLKAHKPDIITVALGSNDIAKGWDEDAFYRDTKKLVNSLPEHAIIAEVPYFGGGLKRGAEKNVPRANEIIREIASKRGLRVASLYKSTKASDSLLIYAADFFHPSSRGHRVWFHAFWDELSSQVH